MIFSFQERMFRQVNNPFADRLQLRARRRAIVVFTVLSALVIGAAIQNFGDRILWLAFASLPFWLCTYLLNLSLRGMFELADERLDEHQIALRNQAYKTAYGYTLIFLIVVATTATVLALGRVATFSIAAVAFLTSALAPRLITAWVIGDSDDSE